MLPALPDSARTGLRKPRLAVGRGNPAFRYALPLDRADSRRESPSSDATAHPTFGTREASMSRHLHLTPLAGALVAACVTVAAAPASAARSPGVSGVVMGVDGKVVAHAKVCIDHNGNARCDANEHAVFSDKEGRFKLFGSGAILAEVGKGATWADPAAHTEGGFARPLVLRSPASDAETRVVGPLSTEVQAILDACGKDATAATAEAQLRARLGVAGPVSDALSLRYQDRAALEGRTGGRDRPHRRRRRRHRQEGRPRRRARGPARPRPHRQRRRHLRREPQLQQPVRQLPRRHGRVRDPRLEEEERVAGLRAAARSRRHACWPSCRRPGAASPRPASR